MEWIRSELGNTVQLTKRKNSFTRLKIFKMSMVPFMRIPGNRASYMLARAQFLKRRAQAQRLAATVNTGLRTAQILKPYFPYARKYIQSFRMRAQRKRQINRLRARRSIGKPVGYATAKRYGIQLLEYAPRATKTLYSNVMINIPDGGGIDQRQRNIVNFRGVKICMYFRNNHSTVPKLLNIAMVIPKNEDVGPNIPVTDFFRGDGNSRAIDFEATLNFLDMHCRNINADKYRVLFHTRVSVQQNSNTASAGTFKFMKYVPIKRQVEFEDGTLVSTPRKNVYLVYYFTDLNNAVTTSAMHVSISTTQYFKEPKN